MGRDGEETCDDAPGGVLFQNSRELFTERRREPCSWGAGEGDRPHEGQHQEASGGTESKKDSEDLASGRGPGRCLGEDTSGSMETGHGVVTFGIDAEYPKEEITMTDYTWVIDQVNMIGPRTRKGM